MPEASCVTHRLSGAKAAAVKYVCGDAQKKYTHTSTKTPTAWISSFFSPAAGRAASARYFLPPRKCQPLRLSAPKQIAAQEPPQLTARAARTDLRFDYNMPQNARTHIGLRCPRRINCTPTGANGDETRGEPQRDRWHRVRCFCEPRKQLLVWAAMVWVSKAGGGGVGVGGDGVECGEQRSDTQTHAFSSTTCLSFNKHLFPPHTSAMAHCNDMIKAVLCSWTSLFRVRSNRRN